MMSENIQKDISELIRDIVWHFGSKGIDGQCCGDLSAPEMRALRAVSASEDCSMLNVAKALGFTKSGATRVVDRLEKRGMVQRARSEKDGRVCCVHITSDGKSIITRFNKEAQERVAQVLANMDPGMKKVLQTSLEALVEAL